MTLSCILLTLSGSKWNTGDGAVDSIRGMAYEKWEGPNVEGRGIAPPHHKTSPAATGLNVEVIVIIMRRECLPLT